MDVTLYFVHSICVELLVLYILTLFTIYTFDCTECTACATHLYIYAYEVMCACTMSNNAQGYERNAGA